MGNSRGKPNLNVRINQHYVSQSYLKAWSDTNRKLYCYRILVSNNSVPKWQKVSLKSIACHPHLYTRINEFNLDSDEIEKWMETEIEGPAQASLSKVRAGKSLSQSDWEHLLRFMALQDVRNPVRLIELLETWPLRLSQILEDTLKECVETLKDNKTGKCSPDAEPHSGAADLIPIKVSQDKEPGGKHSMLKAGMVVGRGLWLFMIKHHLDKTYHVLKAHRWSLINATYGTEWITSDNPVVKLNYYEGKSYDLEGGWGNVGTEILFPLSPKLLLYTQIGNTNKYKFFSPNQTRLAQHFIAENAHRFIFSSQPVEGISEMRPRMIDHDLYFHEKESWEKWNLDQRNAELRLYCDEE